MAVVKFCGMTRVQDAQLAGELGAAFVGVIFAGGPRQLDAERATAVLDAGGPGVRRVGVFAAQSAEEIASIAARARLDVVQLHADPTPDFVRAVRAATRRAVWAAVRIAGTDVPPSWATLNGVADGVVLDARVPGRLGGTGVPLPWESLARSLPRRGDGAQLVLAGGLDPDNVTVAVAALRPDVADVSSGVEVSPGVKDPARMRAFVHSVRRAGASKLGREPRSPTQL